MSTTSPTVISNSAIATSTDDTLVTVTRIYDGDTIDVFQGGETIKVRLACIDSAETNQQPHGESATQALSDRLPGQVRLNVVDTDRYGRLVAEVFTPDGDFVNLQMVEAGEAVVYQRYLDSCGDHASALLAAEQQAQTNGLGVWGDPNFIMPWDWAHLKVRGVHLLNTKYQHFKRLKVGIWPQGYAG